MTLRFHPFQSPDDDNAGAGGAPSQADIDKLTHTLKREREATKEAERKAAQLEAQLKELSGMAPDAVKDAADRARRAMAEAQQAEERYQQQLAAKEAEFEAERVRLVKERDEERKAREREKIRGQVEKAFLSEGGSSKASEVDGSTPFDYIWDRFGARIQSDDKGLHMLTPDGKEMRDDDGKRVGPKAFFATLRKDPTHGRNFEPEYGSGSGARSGKDGRVISKADLLKRPNSENFAEAFGKR
jgi:hypothetical protein